MKKLLSLLLCFSGLSTCWAYYPALEKGSTFQFSLNKNAKKYLEFCVQDIQYSDSTEYNCKALYTFQVTSIGTGIALGEVANIPKKTISISTPYFLNHHYSGGDTIKASMIRNQIIHQDSSSTIQYEFTCSGTNNKTYFYVNDQEVRMLQQEDVRVWRPIAVDISYDGREYLKKIEEKKLKLWSQNMYDSIAAILTIDIDSLHLYGEDSILIHRETHRFGVPGSIGESYYLINENTIKVVVNNDWLKYHTVFYFNRISPYLLEKYHAVSIEHQDTYLKLKQFQMFYNKPANTVEEKRAAFLLPECYTNCIGTSFFTIPIAEKEFELYPVGIYGATIFYDFKECFVGLKKSKDEIVTQITLRLYAEKAHNFIQKALNYGYECVGTGKDVNIRTNSGKLLPDLYSSVVTQYRKKTKGGYVYMEVSNTGRYANEYSIAIYRSVH
jgi:hypothetical protein